MIQKLNYQRHSTSLCHYLEYLYKNRLGRENIKYGFLPLCQLLGPALKGRAGEQFNYCKWYQYGRS